MSTLADKLTAPDVRPRVLQACEDLVESEVHGKSGLTGMAVKGAFKIVKAVKPGIVQELIDHLLPDFAEALEPLHGASLDAARDSGTPVPEAFERHLVSREDETVDALLAVTDRKAEHARTKALKKAYEKLRGAAKGHVAAAVPGLARTLAPFVGDPGRG